MKYMNTYLVFEGECQRAMKFYEQCLGGVLYVMTYGEMPPQPGVPPLPEEVKAWVMHARLTIKTQVLMASDTRPGLPVTKGNNFFVSINCESIEEAERVYAALSVQAQKIEMPLQETFFAHRFGMLTDRFGVNWMLNFEKPKSED